MDKELKLLLDNSKLDQLYKHNLFSIKSICEFLGVWNNYSPEDKFKLENFTKRDTDINKHFTSMLLLQCFYFIFLFISYI